MRVRYVIYYIGLYFKKSGTTKGRPVFYVSKKEGFPFLKTVFAQSCKFGRDYSATTFSLYYNEHICFLCITP